MAFMRIFLVLVLFVLLATSCQPAATTPPPPTATFSPSAATSVPTESPPPAATETPAPTLTPIPPPTSTPTIESGTKPWQPALPEEPCVPSETKACRVLFVGSLAGKPEIWFNTKWTTLYDLEDLSLVLTLPGVAPSIYYRFSLAEFVAGIESTR